MPRSPLRTGLADLPHPALQLVVCSISETDDFRDFGFQQAKEPKFGEVVVRPALVVSASTSAFAAASLSQDGSQSHAYPSVDASKFAVLGVFEVAIPTGKRPVDVRHDGFHALAVDPPRPGFDGFAQLAHAFGPNQFHQSSPPASLEPIAEEVKMTLCLVHVHRADFLWMQGQPGFCHRLP